MSFHALLNWGYKNWAAGRIQIHALAYESDLAAGFVSRRPPELKADEKALGFGRSCLQICSVSHYYHKRCRPGYVGNIPRSPTSMESLSSEDFPTRLLHIQDKGGELQVRVVEVCRLNSEDSEHLMQSGYFTLSYCWGKDQLVKLTLGSEPSLRSGILSSRLPKTLRDAIWVSHSLGRHFLWIDALCILQDSSSDKAVEIAKMAQYYSKSTLTICAASAANCDDGLFQKNNPCQFEFGPIQLEFKSKSGQLGHIYLAGKLAQTESLKSRAWTFQETMLSQRMLIFGTQELFWSCKGAYGSWLDGLHPRVLGNTNGGVDLLDVIRVEHPQRQWKSIVKMYSGRLLGFPFDKLPAVSALASVLQNGNYTRFDDSPYEPRPIAYVAGLYITPGDCQSWIDALFWHVTSKMSSTRSQPYRAPSWSWASVDGQLSTYSPQCVREATDFAVEDYGVTLDNKAAPYGMVNDAFLLIRARCRILKGPITMELTIALENDDERHFERYKPFVSNTRIPFPIVYADTLEFRRIIEEALSGKGAVLLVEMVKLPPSGLILCPINSQNSSQENLTYQRIGCFISQSTDWDWWLGNMNREDDPVFGASQVQLLRIV